LPGAISFRSGNRWTRIDPAGINFSDIDVATALGGKFSKHIRMRAAKQPIKAEFPLFCEIEWCFMRFENGQCEGAACRFPAAILFYPRYFPT
jgi:hypothetical protein